MWHVGMDQVVEFKRPSNLSQELILANYRIILSFRSLLGEYGRVYELIQKGLGNRAGEVTREQGRSLGRALEFPGVAGNEMKEEPAIYC
jgi:hypothetical protein